MAFRLVVAGVAVRYLSKRFCRVQAETVVDEVDLHGSLSFRAVWKHLRLSLSCFLEYHAAGEGDLHAIVA